MIAAVQDKSNVVDGLHVIQGEDGWSRFDCPAAAAGDASSQGGYIENLMQSVVKQGLPSDDSKSPTKENPSPGERDHVDHTSQVQAQSLFSQPDITSPDIKNVEHNLSRPSSGNSTVKSVTSTEPQQSTSETSFTSAVPGDLHKQDIVATQGKYLSSDPS